MDDKPMRFQFARPRCNSCPLRGISETELDSVFGTFRSCIFEVDGLNLRAGDSFDDLLKVMDALFEPLLLPGRWNRVFSSLIRKHDLDSRFAVFHEIEFLAHAGPRVCQGEPKPSECYERPCLGIAFFHDSGFVDCESVHCKGRCQESYESSGKKSSVRFVTTLPRFKNAMARPDRR